MQLVPNHKDPLQLKLQEEIKKRTLAIVKKSDNTEEDPQTLEEFVYGNVIINE